MQEFIYIKKHVVNDTSRVDTKIKILLQIISSARTSFVLKHLAIENFDASGFLIGYQMRSEINLVFPTDPLDDPSEPSGKFISIPLTILMEKLVKSCFQVFIGTKCAWSTFWPISIVRNIIVSTVLTKC